MFNETLVFTAFRVLKPLLKSCSKDFASAAAEVKTDLSQVDHVLMKSVLLSKKK